MSHFELGDVDEDSGYIADESEDMETEGQMYGSTEATLGNMTLLNSGTKEWHQCVTQDIRNHMSAKVVQALLPKSNSVAPNNTSTQMDDLVAYSQRVEGDAFEKANSREEYYYYVAEKIYSIQISKDNNGDHESQENSIVLQSSNAETVEQSPSQYFEPQIPCSYVQKVSKEEYERQKKTYTESAVNNLLTSQDYQAFLNTCHLCGACWLHGHMTSGCAECGGFTITRPCPICQGHCPALWKREISMSHSLHEAHWDGECTLPENEMRAHFLNTMVDASEENVIDCMEQLSTR